jgi:hypothetical protein
LPSLNPKKSWESISQIRGTNKVSVGRNEDLVNTMAPFIADVVY